MKPTPAWRKVLRASDVALPWAFLALGLGYFFAGAIDHAALMVALGSWLRQSARLRAAKEPQ